MKRFPNMVRIFWRRGLILALFQLVRFLILKFLIAFKHPVVLEMLSFACCRAAIGGMDALSAAKAEGLDQVTYYLPKTTFKLGWNPSRKADGFGYY